MKPDTAAVSAGPPLGAADAGDRPAGGEYLSGG